MYKTVIAEGIPGAGKTVFAEELGEALTRQRREVGQRAETLFIAEADEKQGNPYLKDYYSDMSRWASTMQCQLLARRFRAHLSAQYHVMSERGDGVLDRSYFGDVAFAKVQRDLGFMSEREYETYKLLYHGMTSFVLYPNLCVFLDVSIDTSMERISRRMMDQHGRTCEQRITEDYLAAVRDATLVVIDALDRHGTKILRVYWDEDLSTPPQRRPFIDSVAQTIINHVSRREFADIHDRLV